MEKLLIIFIAIIVIVYVLNGVMLYRINKGDYEAGLTISLEDLGISLIMWVLSPITILGVFTEYLECFGDVVVFEKDRK